jgi:hypothetical protein
MHAFGGRGKMKTNTDINSTAIFFLEGISYSGTLEVHQGRRINGKILTSVSLDKASLLNGYFLNVVHVIIRDENTLATLFNCEIRNSYMSTYGLYEYTITSSYLITGDHFNNEEDIRIKKLSLINNDFSELIGNSLVKTTIYTKEKRTTVEVDNESSGNIHEFNDYCSYQRSFHNWYNINRVDFKIHQSNTLVYVFKTELNIYDTRKFILQIELLFTFLFQHPSFNEEIVFFVTDDKGKEDYRHIYFTRKKFNECKKNLNTDIFPAKDIVSNIFNYIENWKAFITSVSYFENYLISYYTTNFIDQKVQGQLYLLNSIHPYIFGKTQQNKYLTLIEKVKKSSLDQLDKNEIVQMLESRNGYSFKKMLFDLFERYNEPVTKQDIDTLNTFRSSQAHGGSFSMETAELIRFNEMLSNLLLHIVKEVLMKKII